MKRLLCILGIVGAAQIALSYDQLSNDDEWDQFKIRHGKVYDDPNEEAIRKGFFADNVRLITEHNKRYEAGEVSYFLEMNHFGDMSENEFESTMLESMLVNDTDDFTDEFTEWIEPESIELPRSLDWRKRGAVTPVKTEGKCSSCWAFSATGSIEGQIFRRTRKLVSLSEQNLIDCSKKFGNRGCAGGCVRKAFEYVDKNDGIDTEAHYPYEGRVGKCRYTASKRGARVDGYVRLPKANERALKKALVVIGPLSVTVDARGAFKFYRGGVYDPSVCDTQKLNRALLVVGYGKTWIGKKFYIVKNSWGRKWGDNGYILMKRGGRNKCGIASKAFFPMVKR